MAFSSLSFLAGVGLAYVLPVVARNFRPLAVEAAAMGLGFMEDLRRVAAERMETLEDIAAEARARREALAGSAATFDHESADAEEEGPVEPPANGNRARRRSASRQRSRAS